MSYTKRILLVLGIVLALVSVDQFTKWVAIQTLAGKGEINYFGGLFRWVFATNRGAFLSLGSGLSDSMRFLVLTAFNAVILVVVVVFLLVKKGLPTSVVVALALILAGGSGNILDRLFRNGLVVDFMNVGIGSLRTGIFNVADMAIMAGLFLLLFIEFRGRHPSPQLKPDEERP